ncbi:nitroreductase [Lachnospiraceae bacterium KM106-2]|nr:nitroreductase [Lachnospiraceae bacterium KM106-2]
MEAMECIKGRRSVRRFTEEKISHEVFEKIVEAASYAPSWKNTQVVRYHVLEKKDVMEQIAADGILGFEFNAKTILNAAAIVVVTAKSGRSGYERDGSYSTPKEDRWEMFDAGIASQTFCLAAHTYGVGTVVLGYFDEMMIKDLLHLPEDENVMALIAAGYPKFTPDMPKRKEVNDLLSFISE